MKSKMRKYVCNGLKLLSVAATAFLPAVSPAIEDTTGYVLLTANDSIAKSTSFNSAGKWSSGAKPQPGSKYLVNSAIRIATPNNVSSATFDGDSLTFDNGGILDLKSYNGAVISANWIFHRGTIRLNCNDNNSVSYTATVAGTLRVNSTAEAPMTIQPANKATENITVSAPMSGDETAFVVAKIASYRATSRSHITFNGDNSDYCGVFKFEVTSEMKPVGYLRFSGPTSIGVSGDPSSSVPFLTIPVCNGTPVLELQNVSMDSKFTIACEEPKASITLFGTNVLFGASLTGGSAAIPVNVTCDALLQSASALNLTFAEGTRLLARFQADGTSVPSSIAKGSTLSLPGAKIPIRLEGILPLTNNTFSATLLQIPQSIRTVTAADIDLDADDFGLMTRTITVETDEDGMQTVSVTFTGNVVYYSVAASSATFSMGAEYWSDGRSVHSDADYLINYAVPSGCYLVRGAQGTFGGRSLTFARGGVFAPKGYYWSPDIISDLRMSPGSSILLTDKQLGIRGNLTTIGKPGDDPCTVGSNGTRTFYVYSNLKGEGPIRFICTYQNAVLTSVLAGNNGDFTGTLEFTGSDARCKCAVKIGDELDFGGNPATFNAAQTRFSTQVELIVEDDVVIDDSNRGMTFDIATPHSNVSDPVDTFNVGEGATLTLDVPMVVNVDFKKTGAGTLGIGGSLSGTTSNLVVSAGRIMPVTSQASRAFRYTMAEGTGVMIDLNAEDEDVLADGFYIEDETHLTLSGTSLDVRMKGAVDRSGITMARGVFNVPSSMASALSAAIGGSVTVVDTATGKTFSRALSSKGLPGDRTLFYVKVAAPGFLIHVR